MAMSLSSELNSIRSVMFIRFLKPKLCAQNSVRFASLKEPLKYKPVQYSTNKAAKVTIAELLGFSSENETKFRWQPLAFAAAVSVIYLYFLFFRTKETGIDELLDFNKIVVDTKGKELIDLKIKLNYCINNKLPTDALKAKIEEIESSRPVTKPFRL